MCDRKEQLIGFLYGEIDPSERQAFHQHLNTCAECREEVAELRATRGQIAAWTPPEPDFGFRIVRGAAAPPPMPRFRISPSWGLAAAAILVMAIGAAIANLEVRFGTDGLVIRTGWNHGGAAPVTAAVVAGAGAGVEPVDWKQQAQQLDRRLNEIEQALARNRSGSVQSAAASGMSEERVREMLGQSEIRQQRIVAARLAAMTRDYDAQRRIDLAAIDQGLTRLQNSSGAEVKQYRDLIQRMYRAAAYQQTK